MKLRPAMDAAAAVNENLRYVGIVYCVRVDNSWIEEKKTTEVNY